MDFGKSFVFMFQDRLFRKLPIGTLPVLAIFGR
jgi:hypothetical protein